MPFAYEELVSPRGRPCVRVQVSGEIGLPEAQEFAGKFTHGGPYFLQPTLSVVARGTEYTAEARKHLLAMGEHGAHAAVITSAIVRAAINLMVRLTGKAEKFRMFTAEPEALAWLDEQE